MRIYNRVVINMTTWETVEADFFEYTGEVAQGWTGAAYAVGGLASGLIGGAMGGGGGGGYPRMSAVEKELLELQLEQLKKQGADAEALRPYILASMGFKEVGGEMVKMSEDEYYDSLSGLDQKGYEVALAAAERSLKAYAGELEISPALEKNLGQRKTELEESLSRNLGSGWQSTTAGIQAMAQFDETSNLIKEEVRSGIITNEGGMTLASLDYMSGQSESTMASFPGQQTGGLFAGAAALGGQYSQNRHNRWQAGMYNKQQRGQRQSGMMSGLGSLVGAGISAFGQYKAAGY